MIKIIDMVKKKGVINSIWYSLIFIKERCFFSQIYNILLKISGYDIGTNVIFGGNNSIFQSLKHSIRIENNCCIGYGSIIRTGFKGTINIKQNVSISAYTLIDIQDHLEVGENSLIAPYCYICDYDHNFRDRDKPIKNQGYISKQISIGSGVWIGAKCVILKGVRIGNGAVIGAGSIVTHDIPSYTVAAGNPAKVIKKR